MEAVASNVQEVWDAQQVATLTRLWGEGKSAGQIAAYMGTTRNAVIGKAHRLKLPSRKSARRSNAEVLKQARANSSRARERLVQKEARDSAAKARGRKAFAVTLAVTAPVPETKPLPPTKAWEALPGSTPVALEQLESHHCRWPIGESLVRFCGMTKSGKSYCETHQLCSRGIGI